MCFLLCLWVNGFSGEKKDYSTIDVFIVWSRLSTRRLNSMRRNLEAANLIIPYPNKHSHTTTTTYIVFVWKLVDSSFIYLLLLFVWLDIKYYSLFLVLFLSCEDGSAFPTFLSIAGLRFSLMLVSARQHVNFVFKNDRKKIKNKFFE